MVRRTTSVAAAIVLAVPLALFAQHAQMAATQATGQKAPSTPQKGAPKAKMTDAAKIRNAMSAAPAEISKNATIMDWPDTPTGQVRQLRAGTNGWVCYPNTPSEYGGAAVDDPMCLDKAWQAWAEAWMSKKDPPTGQGGIAYMLRGDRGGSNTDPFATGPTKDNQWVRSPAHIMLLFADAKALDAYPTDPANGGPWVMFKGTPYAHLMVPVSPTLKATVGMK